MLLNIEERQNLTGLARLRARNYETKTIHPKLLEEYLGKDWTEDRTNSSSIRLRKLKPPAIYFEDQVWFLLFRMGFDLLSGKGGSTLIINSKDPDSPSTQIDAVAIDDEVAIAVECKSSNTVAKRPQFQEELAKLSQTREKFALSVRSGFPREAKRQTILIFFTQNILLTDNDKARAKAQNVVLFDEKDLQYYDSLVTQLGPAAKYQFLSDCLPGKSIPGLEIKVPAVKTRIGGFTCYTFSITPEYLLKISYISHRSKGRASDVDTYQRMVSKSRLNKIRDYISEDGIFPTNIVVNLEKGRASFERTRQEENNQTDLDVGVLGWLAIRPAYKSAWIIDGQHRVFAYSGHQFASKSRLSILAFEGLPPSKQAELFIDINAKQKHVKQSLLEELHAELHWDSEHIEDRVAAVISKSIQELDAHPESPFHERIQKADDSKDVKRCVSFTSIFKALEKTDFYVAKEKNGTVQEFGAFWAGDNRSTMNRTVRILIDWFTLISEPAKDWWDKGSGEGGGLAMNDSIVSCVNVLRSVFQHLEQGKLRLRDLTESEVHEMLTPFGDALGNHLKSFNEEERKSYRDPRGVQGQNFRTRLAQKAIRDAISAFNPVGLEAYLEGQKAQTNQRANAAVVNIERMLQKTVVEELKRECGTGEQEWWMTGVPTTVRRKASDRYEEDGGKRGGRECYLDLIDYKHIVAHHWSLFEPILGFGTGGKEKRLSWLDFVNERRKIVAHPSSLAVVPLADLAQLREYESWLTDQVRGPMVGV